MAEPSFILNDKVFKNNYASNKKIIQFENRKEEIRGLKEFEACETEEDFIEWYKIYSDFPEDMCKIMGLIEINRKKEAEEANQKK